MGRGGGSGGSFGMGQGGRGSRWLWSGKRGEEFGGEGLLAGEVMGAEECALAAA